MIGRIAPWTVLIAAASLGGCADSSVRYPSLALRDFETRPFAAPDDTANMPPAPLPPQAVDRARIAAIHSAAKTDFDRFTGQQASTASAVSRARGAAAESDSRTRALVALADLSALRSATFVHLGDLDLLAANTAIEFGVTTEIDGARRDVITMLEQQNRVISALWSEIEQ